MLKRAWAGSVPNWMLVVAFDLFVPSFIEAPPFWSCFFFTISTKSVSSQFFGIQCSFSHIGDRFFVFLQSLNRSLL